VQERKARGAWPQDAGRYGFCEPQREQFTDDKTYEKAYTGFLKSVSESPLYRRFVQEKLEKAQRASSETGNLYTASIFLALMSTLECDLTDGSRLNGKRFGFVAYGSGSKAKVFEAVVQPQWAEVARHFRRSITGSMKPSIPASNCSPCSRNRAVGAWNVSARKE
jgi:hydroxymethylglutaryl-CoA synthase